MDIGALKHKGAMTLWKCGVSDREKLYAALKGLGLQENYMPAVRGDADCLKAAMKDYCGAMAVAAGDTSVKGPDKLVQSLRKPKKNGFQVLDVERREDDNDYLKSFGCKVDEYGTITITRGYANEYTLQRSYQEHKKVVTGSAVRTALAGIAQEHLGGVMIDSGIFWIPEDQKAKWIEISKAIEATAIENDTKVRVLSYVMDDEGIDAVKDAIISEVFDAAEKLKQEIADGSMGKSALTTRQFIAASLHARVSKYEVILGEALTALHETVRVAEEAAASAIAMKEADEVYAGVF